MKMTILYRKISSEYGFFKISGIQIQSIIKNNIKVFPKTPKMLKLKYVFINFPTSNKMLARIYVHFKILLLSLI